MSFNIKTIGNDGTVGNHPDVTSWLNTISLVGGSASATTISALNTFCNSIDAAGLRNKFYRLNLFCGNNLASCLVPLFGRPTPSGPEYGNGVDENVGFVESDYVETGANGGLKGNGSTKHIRPRLIVSRATGNESVGCYVTQEATVSNPTGTYYLIGSHFPSNNNRSLGIVYYSNQYNIEDGALGISPNGVWSTSLGQATGFRCASSDGLSSRKMYLNGSVIWSNTNTTTASINAISPYLFARSDSGNVYGLGNQRMAGYFIGTSMTDTDMVNLNNAMQAFQTALLRHRASADPLFASITNADARLWIDNAYANGGSVSLSTATAVNTFCNSIDSASIRDRFYRLNLFCGDNLNSAVVPLYRGPSPSGTQFGGSIDTNNNFVSGDYAETGVNRGLKGNQSNKFLNTALSPSTLPSFAHHISVYAPFQNATHAFRGLIGASESLNTRQASLYQWITAGQFNYIAGVNNSVTLTASVTPPPVFMLGSLNGSASAIFVLDGSVTSGTLSSYSASTQPWYVFGESRAGALANPTDARISAYSIGLPMTSGEAASLRSAFVAMSSAMGGS